VAFLLGAGVLAGMVGSAGGIASLISYPVLLAVRKAHLGIHWAQGVFRGKRNRLIATPSLRKAKINQFWCCPTNQVGRRLNRPGCGRSFAFQEQSYRVLTALRRAVII
jgi:hypothetical protein